MYNIHRQINKEIITVKLLKNDSHYDITDHLLYSRGELSI